jgi:hypothetical protein
MTAPKRDTSASDAQTLRSATKRLPRHDVTGVPVRLNEELAFYSSWYVLDLFRWSGAASGRW